MSRIARILSISWLILATGTVASGAATASPEAAAPLHAEFSHLLGTYVHNSLVDYNAWCASPDDANALRRYVRDLSALDPADWPRADALAYWINLYNAVTIQLILDHHPVASIKDIGGLFKTSPWKRKLVTVAGKDLTLNDIENNIVRPTFHDPRVHFALNCASMGCPPLAAAAFLPATIDAQLDANAHLAMNRDRWVRVADQALYLTKIFDWYGQDFGPDDDGVLAFIRRYRDTALPSGPLKVHYVAYDWSLNQVPGGE